MATFLFDIGQDIQFIPLETAITLYASKDKGYRGTHIKANGLNCTISRIKTGKFIVHGRQRHPTYKNIYNIDEYWVSELLLVPYSILRSFEYPDRLKNKK